MASLTVQGSNRFVGSGDQQSIGIQNQGIANTPSNVEKSQESFSDTLNKAIQGVNQLQKDADRASQELATGRTDNVAAVMLASEKADIALRLMVQVRNKIIDAYQEVMKMQV